MFIESNCWSTVTVTVIHCKKKKKNYNVWSAVSSMVQQVVHTARRLLVWLPLWEGSLCGVCKFATCMCACFLLGYSSLLLQIGNTSAKQTDDFRLHLGLDVCKWLSVQMCGSCNWLSRVNMNKDWPRSPGPQTTMRL